MRTQQVRTNMTCNQNCTYCTRRAPTDDRAFVTPSAVLARIDRSIESGAEEIVLTGGEPTLRSDLVELVKHAAAGGARVVLETNATCIDDTAAHRLKQAGLARAVVNLVGLGPEVDAVTRDEGGVIATRRGITALRAAGVSVEISAVVTRSTRPLVPTLPAALVEAFGERSVERIVVAVPTNSADPSELIRYEEAAATLLALDAEARRVGIAVKLHPHDAPPPCVFSSRVRPSHFYALTAGASTSAEHIRVEACERCSVRDRCPGFSREYLARMLLPPLEPVVEERQRRRLSLISTIDEQIERELVTKNRYHDGDGRPVDEEVIRVNFHCNQVCRFCFVSTHLPPATDDAIRRAILSAAERGVKITLSGGEPTLNPKLGEYIALAQSRGRLPVLLQTNAVRLDDPTLTQSLVDAGLREAFVSLHGSRAEIGDAITGAPGTYERSLLGIDRMIERNVAVVLNFVMCEGNFRDLPDFVRMAAMRWPSAQLNLSFVAPSTDVVPRERDLVPRYSDVLPFVAQAVELAKSLRVPIGGFESMCGIPLCLVPAEMERFLSLSEVPPGYDGGEFLKPEPCQRCDLRARCFGVRRGYAEIHGLGELRPVVSYM